MKKAYTSPVAKLFDISAEEKVAANCGHTRYDYIDSTSCVLISNTGNCVVTENQGS